MQRYRPELWDDFMQEKCRSVISSLLCQQVSEVAQLATTLQGLLHFYQMSGQDQ